VEQMAAMTTTSAHLISARMISVNMLPFLVVSNNVSPINKKIRFSSSPIDSVINNHRVIRVSSSRLVDGFCVLFHMTTSLCLQQEK